MSEQEDAIVVKSIFQKVIANSVQTQIVVVTSVNFFILMY